MIRNICMETKKIFNCEISFSWSKKIRHEAKKCVQDTFIIENREKKVVSHLYPTLLKGRYKKEYWINMNRHFREKETWLMIYLRDIDEYQNFSCCEFKIGFTACSKSITDIVTCEATNFVMITIMITFQHFFLGTLSRFI